MAFDPNFTYWQSFKVISRAVFRLPLQIGELEDFAKAVATIAYTALMLATRLFMTMFFPVTIPLFALFVQWFRRRSARRIDAENCTPGAME